MRFSTTALALLVAGAVANPIGDLFQTQDSIENHRSHSAGEALRQISEVINGLGHIEGSRVTSVSSTANTKEVCFWSGTAPFCSGACPTNWRTADSNDCGDGKCCSTGSKKKCCRTFNLDDCYWSGTAPFCDGSCDPMEAYDRSTDLCGDGKCCKSGLKHQCCKPMD